MRFGVAASAIVLFATASSQPSYGEVFKARNTPGRVVMEESEGVTVVDWITRAADGFPVLRRHREFASSIEAALYLRKTYPGREAVELPEAAIVLPGLAGESLWTVTQTWDWNWEVRYSDWIRGNVDADFFVRANIATDCADVAYALRWIFARIHGLPMTSRLITGEWFTQNSMRPEWAGLKTDPEWSKDDRFRAALEYLLELVYTHTLARDGYPVEIRPGVILEGGFHLELHGPSGHTRPLTHVNRAGQIGVPVKVLQSGMPRKVRSLIPDGFWVSIYPEKGKGGFLRFRWPDPAGGLIDGRHMPHYSDEQFEPSFKGAEPSFFMAVYLRLQPGFKLEGLVDELLKGTQDSVKQRQQVVRDGYAYCSQNDCSPDTPAWEAWSTPSRDQRIANQILDLRSMMMALPLSERTRLLSEFREPFFQEDGWKFSLESVQWAWSNGMHSSDPRLSPEKRWNLAPAALVRLLLQKSRQTWADRETFLLTTSSCLPSECVPGSQAWQDRSSSAFDSALIGLTSAARTYCSAVGSEVCAEFTRLLQSGFELLRPGLTLQQTLERFPLLNSDPRHSIAVRRAGLFPSAPRIFFPGLSKLKGDGEFVLAESDGLPSLWRISSSMPTAVHPPAGRRWGSIDLERRLGWFAGPSEIGVTDLYQKDRDLVLRIPFEADLVRFTSAGGAMVRGANQWAHVMRRPGSLTIAARGDSEKLIVLDENHYLNKKGRVSEILSVTPGGVNSTASTIEPSDFLEFRAVETGFLGVSMRRELWFIRRSDGRARRLYEHVLAFFPDSNGRTMFMVTESDALELVELNENGEVISREQVVDPSVHFLGHISVSGTVGGRRVTFFQDQAAHFVRLNPLPGESRLIDFYRDLVVAQSSSSGRYLVRKVTGKDPLYTSETEMSLVDAGTNHPGLIRLCDSGLTSEGMSRQSSCRIESIYEPARHSLLTGVSPLSSYFSIGEPSWRVERGLSLTSAMNHLWLDW